MADPDVQGWLDRMERTFFDDDFEGYAAACHLPLGIVTQGGAFTVGSVDELRKAFLAWRDMLRDLNATQMIRSARDIEQLTEDMVNCRYDTDIMRDGNRLVPRFTSTLTLSRIDGAWKAVAVVSGMANSEFPIRIPRVEDGRPAGG